MKEYLLELLRSEVDKFKSEFQSRCYCYEQNFYIDYGKCALCAANEVLNNPSSTNDEIESAYDELKTEYDRVYYTRNCDYDMGV